MTWVKAQNAIQNDVDTQALMAVLWIPTPLFEIWESYLISDILEKELQLLMLE